MTDFAMASLTSDAMNVGTFDFESSPQVAEELHGATESMGAQAQEGSDYPRLAKLMADAPEISIFCLFKELNILNIMRMQAELHDLEHQLKDIRQEDFEAGKPRSDYVRDFYSMRKSVSQENEQPSEENGQPSKEKREMETLSSWFFGPDGKSFPKGHEATIWPSKAELKNDSEERLDKDFITVGRDIQTLQSYCMTLCLTSTTSCGDIVNRYQAAVRVRKGYDEKPIAFLSEVVSVAISSLLPTLVILVLYFVKRTLLRLGLIIIFTATFSVLLSIFTTGKRVEIFSATAAFTAVEVVFVGTAGNSTA
ncbi:hypothetical protein BDV97DRAFT_390412 [Delphinella strobiligena]|nr:hypothetical protein BDV97DRAFT_390412 [Delphinella strobiligena]